MPDPLRGFPSDEPDPTQAPVRPPTAAELGVTRASGFPVDDPDAADPLRITLGQATRTTPDTAAEVFQLRLKTGLPAGVIERNLADVRRQAARTDFNAEQFRRDNPHLTNWMLADPPRAALVQDDLGPLGALETALTTAGNVARAAGAGTYRFAAVAPWAGLELVGDVLEQLTLKQFTGVSQIATFAREERKRQEVTAAFYGVDVEGMGATEQAVYSGVESLGMNVPAVGLGLLTGGTSTALGLMGTSVGLTSYTQARDVGASVPRSVLFGGTQAGIEVLTEQIPVSWFFKDLATRTGFVKMIAKQVASEIPGEQVATFFQDLSEWTTLHPEAPASAFLEARPGAAYQTLIATVVAAGAQTALITAADRALRPPTTQRVIEDLHAKTAATATHTTAPTELSGFIREAATALPTVYAAVEPFIQYLQQKGVDPAQVAAQLTGDPSAFALALETGDLPIPTENYLTQVVGSGDEAFYATNLRLDANLPTASEWTARTEGEVQAQAAEVAAETTAQAQAEATAPGEAPPPTPQENLRTQMLTELTQGGRVDPATADILARVVAEAFPTLATRAGVELATLVQRWLPVVQRGTTAAAAAEEVRASLGTEGAPPGATYPQGPRARVTFGADGRPIVELFRASNRSSFLHETGHVFLRMMGDLADTLASQAAVGVALTPEQHRLLADYRDVVLPHLGVTATGQVGAAQHEQWARAWEAYLMEGQAPSPALRRVFSRIARWLTRIYKSLQGLSRDAGFEVSLTPEIRAVMNRLLASDAAIDQAEREGGVRPLFTTVEQAAQAGLSPEEFAGYRKLVQAAADARRAQLAQRMMRDLAREEQTWWKAERARVRDEVEAEVQARPEYRAFYAVRDGTTPAGVPLGDPDVEAVAVPLTLSTPDLRQRFGPEILPMMRGLHNEGGLPADMVAPMVGYASAPELVTALATLQPMDAVIEETTDLGMREAHGDLLLNPEALADEAQRAVTDQERDQVIRAEMAMLRKLHAATAPVRAAQREQQRTTVRRLREDVPDRATLDRVATAQIRSLTLPQIRPDRFFAAAARASRRATEQAAKGHTEEALLAKQDELINIALFRAAQVLQDDVEAARAEFARMFGNDKVLATRRNMDYVAAARALAAHYFWPDRRLTQAREALALVEQYNPDLYQELGARIDRVLASGPTLPQLTGGGWLDLHEAVSSLWTLSLRDQQSLIEGKLEDRAAIVAQLTAHLETLGPPSGPRSAFVTGLLGLRAALTRVEHWISYIDRQNPDGVFRRYVFQPVADAVGAYRLAKRDTLKAFLAILEPIRQTLTPGPIDAPELDYTFASKAALLHAIAHTGNPSNLERLLRGRGWGAAVDPLAPLDTSRWRTFMARMFSDGVVTKADMDFVQALWDLNEQLKPAAQAAHHEMFGYYFHELTAAPVDTPFGTYRGGYVPAILDPFESADGTARIHMDAIEGVAQTMFPPAGFVQRRAEHYAQPLALDLSLLPQHLDKVLRFIYLLPRAKEVNRLVGDRRFGDRLHAYDPTVRKDLLQPWLQRAYSQQVTVASTSSGGRVLDRFARALRGRTGLNMMAANIINVLQQYTGLFAAVTKVKPRYLRTALWRFIHHPRVMTQQIDEASAFMQTSGSGQIAEILRTVDDLLLNPTKYEQVKDFAARHGYVLQVLTQNLVSKVTWMGAYEQAIEGGADERGAVNQADSAVRETQGSFNPEDIADIERQTPFVRVFLMFFGWSNMMANLNGYQLAAAVRDMGLRKGAGRALYLYTFGFMLPVVLSEVIRQSLTGWDDDDDETHLDELLWLFFGSQGRMVAQMAPGGQVITSVVNFFNDRPYDDRLSASPAITLLESALRAPHSVYKLMLEDGPKKRAVRDALSAIGLLTGLPVGAVSKPAGYLADMADDNVEPETPIDLVRGLVSGRRPPD